MALILNIPSPKPAKKSKHPVYESFKQGVMEKADLKWTDTVVVTPADVMQTVTPHTVKVEADAHGSVTEELTAEYLTLHAAYEKYQMKQVVKRMEEIKKALHQYANENMDAAKPAIFACDQGELEFSERGKVAVVKDAMALVRDLIEKFDHDVAFSVVDIAITPLRKILNEVELKTYLEDQPGSRTLRAVRRVGG